MSQNNKPTRDKKKLIFLVIIPLLIIFVGFTVFKDMFITDKKSVSKNESLNAGTPTVKSDFVDSLSKTDLYSTLESEKKKAKYGKAVFDEVGNISTDISSQKVDPGQEKENLQARLKNEVAQPVYNDPPVPKFVNTRKNSYGGESGRENNNSTASSDYGSNQKDDGFNSVVLADGNKKDETTGGYGYYGNNDPTNSATGVSALAITDGSQKVSNGGRIKMILKEDLRINGETITKGTEIYGLARFTESRIDVDVRSVNLNNKIVYLRLKGFDLRDGMEGLAMKESDAAKMGKNAFNEELERLDAGVGSQIPGYGGQIAGTIFRTFSRNKRGKPSSVTVPDGYKVILRN